MELHAIDWLIIVGYFALSLGIGLFFKNKAGESYIEYFASGRSLPWWIAGTSMVATTFAADTPLAVTELVAKHGLAGNWFWWAWAFGGMLTVFVFAKLWRRAEVITDVELIELRYTGKPAAMLRGFRGFYIAVVMNSIVIGWVTKAMADVLKQTVLHGTEWANGSADFWLVAAMLVITGVYAVISGMWGVAITDVIQFVLAMGGCVALAVVAVGHVGGIEALQATVTAQVDGGEQAFGFFPDFTAEKPWMPIGVFLTLLLSQWWATWYPGAEPGGGGYIVQRMAACKDERHAVKATLWFQIAHYCLRPWPWILVAFAALAMHPELRTAAAPGSGFPMLIRELAGPGLRGVLLVTFAAAFMSTISTQMNWGASYLVNDLYKRFLAQKATDQKLLRVSRLASVLVLLLGGIVAWFMVTRGVKVDDAWSFLAALGAGVGAVFMLRWFWWRINAWCEVVAMVSSFFVTVVFFLMKKAGHPQPFAHTVLYSVAFTTLSWLITAFISAPTSRDQLLAFYRKVHPAGPGWTNIRKAAGVTEAEAALHGDHMGKATLGWISGCLMIWSALFAIGNYLYGRLPLALTLTSVFAVSGAVLIWVINGLWDKQDNR